jgi:hypothetical protein
MGGRRAIRALLISENRTGVYPPTDVRAADNASRAPPMHFNE